MKLFSALSAKAGLAIGAAVTAVAAVAVVVVVNMNKADSYRSIMVYDVFGEASISREGVGAMKAYVNLVLQSGDSVSVGGDSSLRLKLDDDKYILAEADTEFSIIADGDEENSRTHIELRAGAITNEIQNKLEGNSSYEVTTPNSIVAVRGTVFRIAVEYDEDNNIITRVTTFEGSVATRLIQPDGTVADEEVYVDADSEVLIFADTKNSVYLTKPRGIDFSDLPLDVLEFLYEMSQDGMELCISKEELRELIEGKKEAEEEEPAPESEPESTPMPTPTPTPTPEPMIEDETEETEVTENNATPEASGGTAESAETDAEASPSPTPSAKPTVYCTVTYRYNGADFATQQVEKGKTTAKPRLSPAASGSWNFDFSTVIEEDIVVEWQ